MTKLMEWLFLGTVFLGIWSSIITRKVQHNLLDEYMTIILFLPIILIVIFGVYAVTIILWRVYTFNDCEDAAKELKAQIKEAREDLAKKGFKLEKISKTS